MTETPLYRPITAGEFLHERKMRFSPDSLEATGIPFDLSNVVEKFLLSGGWC